MTKVQLPTPALTRRVRIARIVLAAQGLLLLGAAAYQPVAIRTLLNGSESAILRFKAQFGPEFAVAWLYFGAIIIGGLYLILAVAALASALAIGRPTRWGWSIALFACVGGLALACMPLGIYAIWVLTQPGVRSAVSRSPPVA